MVEQYNEHFNILLVKLNWT